MAGPRHALTEVKKSIFGFGSACRCDCTFSSHECNVYVLTLHHVQEKMVYLIFLVTSAYRDQFSNFFHKTDSQGTSLCICYKYVLLTRTILLHYLVKFESLEYVCHKRSRV